MTYKESIAYLKSVLNQIIPTNKRISKLDCDKMYLHSKDYELVLNALTSTAKKPKNETRIIQIALTLNKGA